MRRLPTGYRCIATTLVACISQVAAFAAQAPLTGHTSLESSNRNPFTTELDNYINGLLDEWKVAGLAIGVVDGEDSYTKAYGLSQLPDTAATTDTLWYVGSTTKAQVAAVLAQMIDNKTYPSLDRGWQTPISSLIRDDFVVSDEWATAHLTLEDAASHRTGIAANFDAYPNTIGDKRATSRDITRLLRHFPMANEPRTKWEYNNYMYTMFSHLIETLTGDALSDTLNGFLWEPLGMNATFLNLEYVDPSKHHVARGYSWDKEQKQFREHPLWNSPGVSGAGTELSTVKDYIKWLRCLINKSAPLSDAAHDEIRKPRMIERDFPAQGFDVSLYGLAWFRTTIHGQVVYQHTGSTDTHGANVLWFPELKYGIVIFLNQPNEVRHVIARRLLEDRLGTPEAQRFDISGYWKKQLAEEERTIAGYIDVLYPDRPDEPVPSTHELAAIAGKYYHPGYGAVHFEIQTNPRNVSENVLIADRSELAFPAQWQLEHVSGDDWLIWRLIYNGTRSTGAYAARIETSVSGNVESINLKTEEAGGKPPTWIVFSRQGYQ